MAIVIHGVAMISEFAIIRERHPDGGIELPMMAIVLLSITARAFAFMVECHTEMMAKSRALRAKEGSVA